MRGLQRHGPSASDGSRATMPPRRVLFSPWTLLVEFIIVGFCLIGVGIIMEGFDLASIIIGWVMAVGFGFVAVWVLLGRIVLLDERGYRVLNRRKKSWTGAQWAEVVDVGIILPNYSVVIVRDSRTNKADAFEGLASFRQRPAVELADQLNDWIAAANPGVVIDTWLHRSNREDNR